MAIFSSWPCKRLMITTANHNKFHFQCFSICNDMNASMVSCNFFFPRPVVKIKYIANIKVNQKY